VRENILSKENGLYKVCKPDTSQREKKGKKKSTKEKVPPGTTAKLVSKKISKLQVAPSNKIMKCDKNDRLTIRSLIIATIVNRKKTNGLSLLEVVQCLEAENELQIKDEILSSVVKNRLEKGVKNNVFVESNGLYTLSNEHTDINADPKNINEQKMNQTHYFSLPSLTCFLQHWKEFHL
jgi:hypothetical protein